MIFYEKTPNNQACFRGFIGDGTDTTQKNKLQFLSFIVNMIKVINGYG